jgi:putative heme-binding domain-containing protein
MLSQPDLDYRQFEAALAASNTLRGNPEAGVTDVAVLAERVTNTSVPARLRGFALRLIPPTHPKIKVPLLRELLSANDPVLSLEVVRTLVGRDADDARAMLAEIAADESRDSALRAEAAVGLSASAVPEHHALLVKLATHDNRAIRNEALRALRSSALDDAAKKSLGDCATKHPESATLVKALLDPTSMNTGRPAFEDTDAWLRRLAALPGKADAEAGRRIFFHPRMALCATCHRHSGRGNVVGPDLSLIARQSDLKGTLQSILEPNREVAPQFFPTLLKLADGGEFIGIMLRSSSIEVYRDITGKERTFKKADILERTELKTSLMPPGLVSTLTDEELRDLLAFVRSDEIK